MIFYLLACVALATASPTPSVSPIRFAEPRNTRIVGGTDSADGEFPWQVTLQQEGRHYCGGSLITANHVMTSAHCQNTPTSVGLGALDYRSPNQLIEMGSFTPHPSYNSNTLDYDYAIITLATTAILGGKVSPIKMVDAGREYIGAAGISGWGFDTRAGQSTPITMQKATVPLVSFAACKEAWGRRFNITPQMQCAGGDNIVSACSGDSGGPLTVVDNGETILIGAASWAESTCNPTYPAGYAKLSVVRPWIDSVINMN